ncbi:hypothetical protein F5148DRAFT_1196038, partial [Russula earlei]
CLRLGRTLSHRLSASRHRGSSFARHQHRNTVAVQGDQEGPDPSPARRRHRRSRRCHHTANQRDAADSSSTLHAAFHIVSPSTRALTHAIATCSGGSPFMAIARRWHEQRTSRPHPPLPSTMLRCLPQSSPVNATRPMARQRLQAGAAAMRCTTTTHDDRVEHAHVHVLPLSTTGSSTLTLPSPASLPHAP